ncbi:uncharacterized protein LOC122033986 [Zingiber officinale]|uniref:uncharacterized protein LOC122033986 n=1 Tax=Zingiber officinale TaxID=94328 RepID=UPI001C4CD8E8|nr:uncharacterized protein LOC122033986 [Zingiber officinale]
MGHEHRGTISHGDRWSSSSSGRTSSISSTSPVVLSRITGDSSLVRSSKSGAKAMTSSRPSSQSPTSRAMVRRRITNWEIFRSLQTRLDHAGGNYVNELSSVLWALRTAPKEATSVTPFQLVYGGEEMVPIEVGVESDWNYNKRVILRPFQVGDLVWKKIKSIGDITKLEAPWVGPYKVVQKLHLGAYYLEDKNGRRLKRS